MQWSDTIPSWNTSHLIPFQQSEQGSYRDYSYSHKKLPVQESGYTKSGVMVQLDEVEVHELQLKILTKDEGVSVHYQSRTDM